MKSDYENEVGVWYLHRVPYHTIIIGESISQPLENYLGTLDF